MGDNRTDIERRLLDLMLGALSAGDESVIREAAPRAARDWVEETRDAHTAALARGETPACPCCGHQPSRYRRKLNSGIAKILIDLYRLGGGSAANWVNVVKLFPGTTHRGGEWAIARHWGLIIPGGKRTAAANSNGDWRLTPLGVAFVEGRMKVYSHITFLEGEPVEREGEISIYEALGNKFSYPELMGIEP